MYLTFVLTYVLGMFIYGGIYVYSFKLRPKIILRSILSVVVTLGVTLAMVFAMYGGLNKGVEINIRNVEFVRIFSYALFFAMLIGIMFFCFDEKPTLILFAAVSAGITHVLSDELYDTICMFFNLNPIFFIRFNGFDPIGFTAFFLVHGGVLFLSYFLFGKPFAKTPKSANKSINKGVIALFVFYTAFLLGFSKSQLFNDQLTDYDISTISLVFNLHNIIIAVFMLFILRFTLVWIAEVQENEIEKNFYDNYHAQMEAQLKNMELINIKCHDLKHQLRTMMDSKNMDTSFVEEVQKAVSIYDSHIFTGNETLDVLLSEKSLICEVKKIQLTAMVDGEALSFMPISDINAFFGNAVDNAIEYLLTVPEENRFIRISSKTLGSNLSIRIENYCDKEIVFNEKGLPATQKDPSYHGYGTKSIKAVAEKYGGTAKFAKEGELFIVTALFMIN